MKRLSVLLTLSILLLSGSGVAYADKHNNRGRDHDRKEQRFIRHDNRGKGNRNGSAHHKFDNKWHKTPPPPAPAPSRYDIERNHRFHEMVARAAYGGSDVRVWRINHDTYIVKYRKGRRWYTRKFYPYSNRYDAPGIININWNPMSAWTLIPSVNINIPINLN